MANFSLPEEVLRVLAGLTFPVTTDELADYAKDRGASEEVLAQLRFQAGHIFKDLNDINLTYGLIEEASAFGNGFAASNADEAEIAPGEKAHLLNDTVSAPF